MDVDNMNKSDLENLSDFILHAKGNLIMISGYDDERNKHTFVASSSILKYLLCDLNKKIIIGSLSRCQLGSLFNALEYIDCGYKLISINDQMIIMKSNNLQRKRFRSK